MMTDPDATPSAEDTPETTPPTEAVHEVPARKRPKDYHARLVEEFAAGLEQLGEKAFDVWGLAFMHSLDDETVMAQFEALKVKPADALDFYNFGCLWASREQYDKALEAFAQAREMDPELPEACYNEAMAAEISGDATRARKLWQAYIDTFAPQGEDLTTARQHLGQLAEA